MKSRWGLGGRKKAYCLIFLSYLLILFVPIVGSVFLHLYNVHLVREQSEDMAQRMLDGIRDRIDSYMNSIWQMNLIAAQLDSVNDMLAMREASESEEAYGLYQVVRELEMFYSFDQSLEDLFVYSYPSGSFCFECRLFSAILGRLYISHIFYWETYSFLFLRTLWKHIRNPAPDQKTGLCLGTDPEPECLKASAVSSPDPDFHINHFF